MVQGVANGVKGAIADAGISPANVHFVQIKCSLLAATHRTEGQSSLPQDSDKSMAYPRRASALGIALALGEISPKQLTDADICHNCQLYLSVASTSSGVELRNCEILVLGNSPTSYSQYSIVQVDSVQWVVGGAARHPPPTVLNPLGCRYMSDKPTETWPRLELDTWQETYITLHMWTQIVGKIRLVQTPWINHSWHVPLYIPFHLSEVQGMAMELCSIAIPCTSLR